MENHRTRKSGNLLLYILEDFETHHHIFAFFLQTVHAIEKLLARFNVQPRIGMNQSLILTALSRDAADDVT